MFTQGEVTKKSYPDGGIQEITERGPTVTTTETIDAREKKLEMDGKCGKIPCRARVVVQEWREDIRGTDEEQQPFRVRLSRALLGRLGDGRGQEDGSIPSRILN